MDGAMTKAVMPWRPKCRAMVRVIATTPASPLIIISALLPTTVELLRRRSQLLRLGRS
jgi:hypothetical protein